MEELKEAKILALFQILLCNLFGISSEDLIGSLTTTKPDDGISNDFQKLTLEDKLSVANYVDFLLSRYK